jgi:hypothetical protein
MLYYSTPWRHRIVLAFDIHSLPLQKFRTEFYNPQKRLIKEQIL